MATYPVPAVGQRLTAEFIESMLPQTARKTSPTTIQSDAIANGDSELTLPVVANASYEVLCQLFYTSPTAADFKFLLFGPTGYTGDYGYTSITTGSAAGSYADDQSAYSAIGSTPAVGGGAANVEVVTIIGNFQTAGTAGSLVVAWAQNTSTASDTILRAGSYLKLTRIG